MSELKITECPRDAMQGIKAFIPTEKKVNYINSLLKVGFNTIDFGSFVSPKAIPQMQDTVNVLKNIDMTNTSSKLLAIVANYKGAEDACAFSEISYLGFPFSISETFQKRNANATITESLQRVEEIQNLCLKHNKQLVVYISMAFGNPYGDVWHPDIAINWCKQLREIGIKILPLADTIGCSTTENITHLFTSLISEFKDIEFGAHLHSTPEQRLEKINAAYKAGCRSFDTAVKGFGGCPMAKDELTGNIATESLMNYCNEHQINTKIDKNYFNESLLQSALIFDYYH
ncbi:MAG: hydroxymethylglutaryl-CoA lyase [Bacteroidetes bacterium]|nr:hydroxymethylglutaryl-CoA lyase [Bacteroidota bacterium]